MTFQHVVKSNILNTKLNFIIKFKLLILIGIETNFSNIERKLKIRENVLYR